MLELFGGVPTLVGFEGGFFGTHFDGGMGMTSKGLKVELWGWGGAISWEVCASMRLCLLLH